MRVVQNLAVLALRQLVSGACEKVGFDTEAVVGFLAERFTDQSQRLTVALQEANERAWKALEIALAGESYWDRCKALLARAEDRAFAEHVRTFLDAAPLAELAGRAKFRQQCLEELRAARKKGILSAATLDSRQLTRQAGSFARFADPLSLADAEWQLVAQLAEGVGQAGYPNLAWLLARRPQRGAPLLVAGVRYFFRRAVEEDARLFQGLAFARLEALAESEEKGFAALSSAMAEQGHRLEELLAGVQAVVVETHGAVLDLQEQLRGQTEQIRQIGQAVLKLLEQHQLQRVELRPADSQSIRGDGERRLVEQLVARYRALPEDQRLRTPALLHAVGKLEVAVGDFDAAQRDFRQVATLVSDAPARAEAHFHSYRTALERRDWVTGLRELVEAARLDSERFAPFPMGKYQPLRILGAGGFGVAFLCQHKYMAAQVVVKALTQEDLDQDAAKVFSEAQLLREVEHPAIIRISDCGFARAGSQSGSFLVMDYFESLTLEEYVQRHGPLPADDCLAVARQIADGLQAAHRKGILHRDVKPANLLVRKEGGVWRVKIIDFGLALRQQLVAAGPGTSRQGKTVVGSSIAGTLDYAAPEQLGRRGEAVGPYSDVYGFAKTCCFALFQTTQPLFKHWQSILLPLAETLEKCLEEDPAKRPPKFAAVLKGLDAAITPPARTERLTDWPDPEARRARPRGPDTAAEVSPWEESEPILAEEVGPSRSEEFQETRVKLLVTPPALGLLLTGAMGFLLNFAFPTYGIFSNVDRARANMQGKIVLAVVFYGSAAASVVTALGGLRMLFRRRYWLAITGSILATIGLCAVSILGLPVGIWALVVLHKPEVRASFE
jgi:serine/threonine protein kinase